MSVNNDLEYQRHIRYQFESFCKKVIGHERCDYLRWKLRYAENETNFSDLPTAYLEGLSIPDGYPGEEYVFHVCGYQVVSRQAKGANLRHEVYHPESISDSICQGLRKWHSHP